MPNTDKRFIRVCFAVALLIITAAALRQTGIWIPELDVPAGLLRTALYFGLFLAWGASVQRRIIHTPTRRYLTAVSALIVFWFAVRTVKYFFVADPTLTRLLWYMYYIPMILVPLLALLTAVSIGLPEDRRPPVWTRLLFIPAAVLLITVLMNDLHRLVFSFPMGLENGNEVYEYNRLYWVVMIWEIACSLAALTVMILKSRGRSDRMRWLPFAPLGLLLLYAVLYAVDRSLLHIVAGDITVVYCLLFMAVFECCIISGLIQSNRYYNELFRISGINARITDPDYNVVYAADLAEPLDRGTLRMTETAPVMLGDGMRLSGAPIRAGRVLWQDDVNRMAETVAELEDINDALEDSNVTLREEYETRRRRLHLTESNRLYNLMQIQTAKQLDTLTRALDELAATDDREREKELTALLALTGAYIKRRNNLLFISETQREIPTAELEYCFRESTGFLQMRGVAAGYAVCADGSLHFMDAMRLYDVFEAVVEGTFGRLKTLFAGVSREDGLLIMRFDVCGGAEFDALGVEGLTASHEDGDEWLLEFRLPERRAGGA